MYIYLCVHRILYVNGHLYIQQILAVNSKIWLFSQVSHLSTLSFIFPFSLSFLLLARNGQFPLTQQLTCQLVVICASILKDGSDQETKRNSCREGEWKDKERQKQGGVIVKMKSSYEGLKRADCFQRLSGRTLLQYASPVTDHHSTGVLQHGQQGFKSLNTAETIRNPLQFILFYCLAV